MYTCLYCQWPDRHSQKKNFYIIGGFHNVNHKYMKYINQWNSLGELKGFLISSFYFIEFLHINADLAVGQNARIYIDTRRNSRCHMNVSKTSTYLLLLDFEFSFRQVPCKGRSFVGEAEM